MKKKNGDKKFNNSKIIMSEYIKERKEKIKFILQKEKFMRLKVFKWDPVKFTQKVWEINDLISYVEYLENLLEEYENNR